MISLKVALQQRQVVSKQEYGTALTSNNGRNPLIDALQEKLDCIMYLRQAIQDYIDGIGWLYSDNFWVRKEPKPILNSNSTLIIDLVCSDLITGVLYLNIFYTVPNWLIILYANELESAKMLLNNIQFLRGKTNALRN